ncbi:hypothetical protein T310_7842 [Rasamsonia emersonii CBS 393.64]|uniref:Uncharacterized protein n=1 Tax=Rasamsonia emersonii (strain ATCC 16479 / CBS 393.64 / IMI 116815) TaxID=1408163 RepID=A0A0F4YK31_RASE3|nr:hypothetical protein T310_7842 [Rasamsonia emersonii CBS 393.64]KKA18216.1 hypothetical protein T310_7842 [Rasamsonia emersonii CBS 393.64]
MTTATATPLFAAFNGAITTRLIAHPHRALAFAFEVTFVAHLWPAALAGKKPPLHFHPHQEEYIEVLEGQLCVEVEGHEHVLSAADGEFCVRPWSSHCLYPPVQFFVGGDSTIRFLLAGQETSRLFRLDTIFFENWYGYQDEVVLRGRRSLDLIQVMCVRPHHPGEVRAMLKKGAFVVDVRRRRLVPVVPLVGAVWQEPVPSPGHRAREMDRWIAGLSAVLSKVDGGLGAGVPEDGDDGFSETVCGEEGGLNFYVIV